MSNLSAFNQALISMPKRAEKSEAEKLQRTFTDLGIMPRLEVVDNQVIYGRRGTGKTHALRNLEVSVIEKGDAALFISLDALGTPKDFSERHFSVDHQVAANLLADFLEEFCEGTRDFLSENGLNVSDEVSECLHTLEECLSDLREGTRIGRTRSEKHLSASSLGADLRAASGPARANLRAQGDRSTEELNTESIEYPAVEFADLSFSLISKTLRELTRALSVKRLWILIDEWSSVPSRLQPYLAHYLKRCVFPIQKITVKIAAIEQKTNFRLTSGGEDIGIELGADVTANVNLDQELSYEQNMDKSNNFFRTLFFKHLSSSEEGGLDLKNESEVIRQGFTEKRSFEELVRAAEGVPRDAINIASLAAGYSENNRIKIETVRRAAHEWFLQDKKAAISDESSNNLLNWIVDKVIRGMHSRGFLVEERFSKNEQLMKMFDQRVLHIVKRGYSAQDRPGIRFDMWTIDYGAYVDLIGTKNEPRKLLGDDAPGQDTDVSVPILDRRKVRRSILDLDKFYS